MISIHVRTFARALEFNPVEQVWQFLLANLLSNRVLETHDEIIEATREAWNRLVARTRTITSIGMRDWAHIGQS